MKIFSKTLLWVVALHFVLVACSHHKDNSNSKATLTIKSKTQRNAKVKLSRYHYLDDVTINESNTDSTGHSSLEVPLDKFMFVNLQVGEKYVEVYLTPGYDLSIEEVDSSGQRPLFFSGKGAEINNYIAWVNKNVERIRWANGKGMAELNDTEFLHRFDSLKTTLHDFHQHYTDSVDLSDEVVAMLEYKSSIKLLQAGQEFKFFKLNNINNAKWEAHRNGQEYMGASLSKGLEDLTDNIPFDTALLTNGYFDYHMLLNFYWQNKINIPVSEQMIATKVPDDKVPLMSNALLKKMDYPEAMREYLIAFDFQYWLAAYGINKGTDSVLSTFKRTYPASPYLPVLNKRYNEWLAVAPGKPAPDFEGYTLEGKKISIKDLKGKLVYMDVWATWCGPCVEEIPASKKLQKEFAGEKRIQFLNVSVDRNKSAWEKFLQKDKAWKGLHIILPEGQSQSFYTRYKLFGVPDYILIDHEGNIVNMKAPHPSEENSKAEIDKLLAKVP